MKNVQLYILMFLIIGLTACQEDEPELIPSLYTACCDVEPVEYISSNVSVFIPNAFTPNGDGINDLFEITCTNIDFVTKFEIKDQNEAIVFSKINFSAYFDPLTWDGTISHFGNEGIVGGLYDYELDFLTIHGVTKVLSGSVCAYLCDDVFPEDKANCLFSTQLDGSGFDPNIGAQEGKCFN